MFIHKYYHSCMTCLSRNKFYDLQFHFILLFLKNSQTLNGDRPIFIAVAPITPIPKDPQQLTQMYNDILELSHNLVICRFSVADDHLFMSAGRFAEGMDSEEALEIMQQLAVNANAIDDKLKERYPNF